MQVTVPHIEKGTEICVRADSFLRLFSGQETKLVRKAGFFESFVVGLEIPQVSLFDGNVKVSGLQVALQSIP